jgi:NDP-sugar pyrophosphorylase family protein
MMAAPPPVCILAGGLGTRLGARVREVPKPLLEVAGQPFLLHQLRLLARHGVRQVVLCVGYLGEQFEALIGASQFGISIGYSYDGPDLAGTLGAVRGAQPLLGERFLVLYGDTYLKLDYRGAAAAWERSGAPAMMTVLRNDGQWDKSNVVFADDCVLVYDKRTPTPQMHWIDYGLGGLTAAVLELVPAAERDLAALYTELSRRGELFGFEATERFHEIGSPQALAETDAFLRAETNASSQTGQG